MDLKSINYFKVVVVILTAIVLLWGLFYFANNSQNNLVSENSIEEENVLNLKTSEIVDNLEINNDKELKNENLILRETQLPTDIEVEKQDIIKEEIVEKDIKEETSNDNIENKLVSWGFTPSAGREIDTIVLHSSYNALEGDEYDLNKLINIYKKYGVAAHYLIDREGDIYRLVEDKNIAYHAGVSKVPDGRNDVNDFSIGIEIMNTKTDDYEKKQYASVNWLIEKIKKDYNIKYILGHSEIAPERKTDPWNIDWDKIIR